MSLWGLKGGRRVGRGSHFCPASLSPCRRSLDPLPPLKAGPRSGGPPRPPGPVAQSLRRVPVARPPRRTTPNPGRSLTAADRGEGSGGIVSPCKPPNPESPSRRSPRPIPPLGGIGGGGCTENPFSESPLILIDDRPPPRLRGGLQPLNVPDAWFGSACILQGWGP